MIFKVLSFIFALLLFGIIIYLGLEAAENSSYVIWFGLASTLLAPVGFALIGFSFKKSDHELFHKLSKVSEIDSLYEQAKTQEEKIKILEQERKSLEDTIKYEVLQSSLIEKKKYLELDAEKLISEFEQVEEKLALLDSEIEEKTEHDTIQRLKEKIKARRDNNIIIKIGKEELIIDVAFIKTIPIFGEFVVAYIKLFQDIAIFVNKLFYKSS